MATASQTGPTLRLFWRISRQWPLLLTLALVAPVVTVFVSQFLGPLVIARLLDLIQSGDLTSQDAWQLVFWYALTQILGQIVGWRIALWAVWTFEIRGMQDLYERVFRHLMGQSMAFHADRFGGALVSQTTKLTGAFEMFWDTVVWSVLPIATSVIAAAVILSFVAWPYAIFLAVMSILAILWVYLASRRLEPLNVAEAGASNHMTGFLADVVTNIAAVKASGNERAESARAADVAGTWNRSSRRVMRAYLGFSATYATIMTITNVGAVVAAVLAAQAGGVAVATIYLAVTYTLTVTDQLWQVNDVMRNYNRIMGDSHEMVATLQNPPAVADTTDTPLAPGPGAVVVDRITFGHSDAHADPLFRDFSLSIAAGERIGLVGHSGSGKTTLTRLLLRFADVAAGSITIDGQDLRSVTQSSLRRAIAYVPQEPLLFHRTLTENIAYGRTGAGEDEVRDAAAKAHALSFIEGLPQGFDTLVGERGVKLSGGQRQRVAIARAILQDAPILILDEATSALDSDSEVQIQKALAEAMRGRTTIVIAHRLSTVQLMDRIVVLDAGRIVEQGSHRELLAAGGTYAGLWAHQSGGFLSA